MGLGAHKDHQRWQILVAAGNKRAPYTAASDHNTAGAAEYNTILRAGPKVEK